MANTCRAADLSMPTEIEEAIKQHIRKHPDPQEKQDFLDDDWFCLLKAAGSARECPVSSDPNAGRRDPCLYQEAEEKQKQEHKRTKPIVAASPNQPATGSTSPTAPATPPTH